MPVLVVADEPAIRTGEADDQPLHRGLPAFADPALRKPCEARPDVRMTLAHSDHVGPAPEERVVGEPGAFIASTISGQMST